MSPDADTQFVAPEALPFKDGELDLLVGPATVKQCFAALRVARVLVDELLQMPADMAQRLQAGQPEPDDVAWLFDLVCEHGELACQLVTALTPLQADQVGQLLPDRFAYLFALLVHVNADFFGRAAPTLAAAKARLQHTSTRMGWLSTSTP